MLCTRLLGIDEEIKIMRRQSQLHSFQDFHGSIQTVNLRKVSFSCFEVLKSRHVVLGDKDPILACLIPAFATGNHL